MIFFFSFGNGGGQWYLGPLLCLLPTLLSSGILGIFADVGEWVLRQIAPSWSSGYQKQGSRSWGSWIENPVDALVLLIIVAVAVSFLLRKLINLVQRHGSMQAALRALLTGVGGGWGSEAQAARPQPRQAAQNKASIASISKAIQQHCLELHATPEEIQAMHTHELKDRLKARGVDCSNFLEKKELVTQLVEGGGSSASSCSVCCEDFETGDPVRVLKCSHRFHVECIDRWFYSSTDYSRPPACPLCNTELQLAT